MDRQILLAMLSGLPDDALMKAFSAIAPKGGSGATMGGGQDAVMAGMAAQPGDKIQGWKERQVPYGGGADRPPISDKTWAQMTVKPRSQEMAKGANMPGVNDYNPYMQTGGM